MIPILSNSKLSSIAGLVNPSPTPYILLALDAQRSLYNESNTTQHHQPDDLVSSLVYCLNILCHSLGNGFLLEHRQFILSCLHSILQLSDSPILWSLSIRYCSSWLIDRRTPLSTGEQVDLFRCIINLEKWSMESYSQGTMCRLIALIEHVASHSSLVDEHAQDLKRLYPLRSEIPNAISMSAYALLSSNSELRAISIQRFFQIHGLSLNSSHINKFLQLMKMNWKHAENRYWLSCIPSIFLTGFEKYRLNVVSLDLPATSESSHRVTCVLPLTNSYGMFVSELQKPSQGSILRSLCTLSFFNPAIADSIWSECLNFSWQSSSKSVRELVCHELCSNLARHDYLNLSWPSHPIFQNTSLPTNIPSKLIQTLLTFDPEPDFPSEFLAAVGSAYGFWHESCEKLYKNLKINTLSRVDAEHELKIIIATLMDLGDVDSVRAVYSRFCQFPFTNKILSLQSYASSIEEQEMTLQALKSWPKFLAEKNFDYEPLELGIWEDRWLDSARQLSQWNVILDFSENCQLPSLGMEAAWMKCDWNAIRKYKSMPEISVQYERNNCFLKLIEAQSHIVDQKLTLAEKCCNSAIHMALFQWCKLPPIQSAHGIRCTHSTAKNLLHFFHQIVEIRDSISMMNEVGTKSNKEKNLPDFKSNLAIWRERLPDSSDNFIKWEQILQWRTQFFQSIKGMYQTITDEAQLACLHDNNWTIISLAKQARKHNLKDLSVSILSRLHNIATMDIFDAYSKLREEIMSKFETDSNVDCTQTYFHGINIINSTNLEYFSPHQKAELIRLKALLQLKLKLFAESKQTLSHCVQMCPTYSKSWITWGEFYYNEYYNNVTTSSSNILSNIQIIEDGQCIISCILKGIESNSDIGRIQLNRILLILMSHDENTGFVLTRYLVQESKHLPIWIWIPFLPILLHILQLRQRELIFEIIKELALQYPQFLGHLTLPCDFAHQDQLKQLIRLNNETLYADLHSFYGEVEFLLKQYRPVYLLLTYVDNLYRGLIDNPSSLQSLASSDIQKDMLQFFRLHEIPEPLKLTLTNDLSLFETKLTMHEVFLYFSALYFLGLEITSIVDFATSRRNFPF